jgi:stage V sporulation protein K
MEGRFKNLIDRFFAETPVIRDYEMFYKALEHEEKTLGRPLTSGNLDYYFNEIQLALSYFISQLGPRGLTLSNLFSYMLDAHKPKFLTNYKGSRSREKITFGLIKFMKLDERKMLSIEELFPKDEGLPKADVKPVENSHVEESSFVHRYKLDKLVGLRAIKDEIEGLIAFANVRKLKIQNGIPPTPETLHMVFYGNPGTGKTTVARLIGAIYKDVGLLEKGHLVEVSRVDLIEKFVGHTAKKVEEQFKAAIGGVLFIDEAYSLYQNESGNDFGKEAIDTLNKLIEDYREQVIVILAGYRNEMERFFTSNSGLKSRFSHYIHFPDYSVAELIEIFENMFSDYDHFLSIGAKFRSEMLIEELEQKRKLMGNARDIRTLFEKTVRNQAIRLAKVENPDRVMLREIAAEDIPEESSLDGMGK